MKLSIRESASADLRNIYAWIARDSPSNAAAVITQILDAMEQVLVQFPMIGRAGKAPGTREWVVRRLPYVVVYEIDFSRDVINVISVKHGAQRR